MIPSTDKDPAKLGMTILVAHGDYSKENSAGVLVRKLVKNIEEDDIAVLIAETGIDAKMLIEADPTIQGLMLDWDIDDPLTHMSAINAIQALRSRSRAIPIFLFTDRGNAAQLPEDILRTINDFIWLYEDTADFIAGRVHAALRTYRSRLLPPMFNALCKFATVHEYSWHTPGHTGGTAFLKSPIGRAFFNFFGENLFRSDLSISVGELGSLLDHSGPIGESEKFIAKVFGADMSFTVTNGSSDSNRVIIMSSVTRNQVALCDRNAHKSIEHGITMSGAIPTYLVPTRNQYGIIGPIPPVRLTKEAVQQSLLNNPLITKDIDPHPVHCIITNSTYDGLCYNVARVEELIDPSTERLHFDEAWYGYARFNPIYEKRFAMHGDPKDYNRKGPTLFATQSTHKLLAALSQASMIHIREGRRPISHDRFNQSFMMHASTSPQYAIIASNDVSAGMMKERGTQLTGESILEAVAFRKLIARLHAEFKQKGEWFVHAWQPDTVANAEGLQIPFWQADENYLATHSACWELKPGDSWHGFKDLEAGYCMLDPIKVTIATPGVSREGPLEDWGIPAYILTSYLDHYGIVVEKTADFTILFLFSMGITKGKWGTLATTLLRFKKDYDNNAPLERVIPKLTANYPERYNGMGLRDLCNEMFAAMKSSNMTSLMSSAFSILPKPDMTPGKAYELLVLDQIERIKLDDSANRTLATGIVPYPPGIPLLMPGENMGPADGPILGYMKALQDFDRKFPGFEHDNHGVTVQNGDYMIDVIKK